MDFSQNNFFPKVTPPVYEIGILISYTKKTKKYILWPVIKAHVSQASSQKKNEEEMFFVFVFVFF